MNDEFSIDADALLFAINSGKAISPREWDAVAELLEQYIGGEQIREVSLDDIYSLLVVVGKGEKRELRPIVTQYLELRDPLTVSYVLELLCLEWDLTSEYLERVSHFAVGSSWDPENDVQQSALKILGEYLFVRTGKALREYQEKHTPPPTFAAYEREALRLLLDVFRDVHVETWARRAAYFALLRASGRDFSELPAECADLSFAEDSTDIDHTLLKKLEALAQSSS